VSLVTQSVTKRVTNFVAREWETAVSKNLYTPFHDMQLLSGGQLVARKLYNRLGFTVDKTESYAILKNDAYRG
jgi:hypothetical protein